MKKTFLYIAGLLGALAFSSCDQEIDIWDSATFDYSGTYMYQVYAEDGTLSHDYDNEFKLEFYNTAANVANEIYIDDHDKYFEFRQAFSLDGDFSSFVSKSTKFEDLKDNEKALILPGLKTDEDKDVDDADFVEKPTALNQAVVLNRNNIRSAIVEGKIITDGATTLGKNITDSLYVKVILYSGTVSFKSAEVPLKYRANPDKEEFEWKFDEVVNTSSEVVIIKGHRYTGFEEDKY